MFVRTLLLTMASCLIVGAAPAWADLVTHSFSGTITKITTGGQNGTPIAGVGGVDTGDLFTGSFTYDTADAGADLDGSPSSGLFFFDPTTTNTVSVNIDGNVFDTPIGSVSGAQTFDNTLSTLSANTDVLDIFKGGPNLPTGWSVTLPATSLMHVAYLDATGTALPNDQLPTSFDPAAWQIGQVIISFTEDVVTPTGTFNNVYIEGTITVPEPSSIILASSALFVAGFWGFRRRKGGAHLPA